MQGGRIGRCPDSQFHATSKEKMSTDVAAKNNKKPKLERCYDGMRLCDSSLRLPIVPATD